MTDCKQKPPVQARYVRLIRRTVRNNIPVYEISKKNRPSSQSKGGVGTWFRLAFSPLSAFFFSLSLHWPRLVRISPTPRLPIMRQPTTIRWTLARVYERELHCCPLYSVIVFSYWTAVLCGCAPLRTRPPPQSIRRGLTIFPHYLFRVAYTLFFALLATLFFIPNFYAFYADISRICRSLATRFGDPSF